MDELTRRRLAHNEALFREVNEEIESHRVSAGPATYVCECTDTACAAELQLTADEYAAVRAGDARFVVAPGHVLPAIEHVVARTDDHTIVEKDVPV
jgi:hypothetical protein